MMLTSTRSVNAFLARVRAGPILPRPEAEPWDTMIRRISDPHYIAEIDEVTYDHFLNVLPPRWMGHGFQFAEGSESLRYFWKWQGRYFCRQLTPDETERFCAVAGISVTD